MCDYSIIPKMVRGRLSGGRCLRYLGENILV